MCGHASLYLYTLINQLQDSQSCLARKNCTFLKLEQVNHSVDTEQVTSVVQ